MRPTLRLLLVAAVLVAGCTGGEARTGIGQAGTTSAAAPPTSPASPTATAGATPQVPPLHPSVDEWEAGLVEVVAADGRAHAVAVRVARTPDQRAHGLMEVPELPDGVGMWFVYADERTGGFWMKNTLVALDIVYVDGDGRIVDVAEAVPCEADPCPTYPPDAPYRSVLEVPAGYLDRIGAGVGDTARLVAA